LSDRLVVIVMHRAGKPVLTLASAIRSRSATSWAAAGEHSMWIRHEMEYPTYLRESPYRPFAALA